MEDGDSAHSEHTHRSSNNAGHYQLHGTWAVQFLRKPLPDPSPKEKKPLPNPSPKREGLFGSSACTQKKNRDTSRTPVL